jgi:nucleotide-binding universal stress UspA family protein
MKTILVPTDFSKCANNAMIYALEVAKRLEARVVALYVVLPNEGVDNSMYDAFMIDDYLLQRKKAMKVWVRKFTKNGQAGSVQVETDCRVGFPVSTVVHVADELDADMIVMGTTGAAGLKGVLLGSTAGGVLVGSQRPVLVIPKGAVFQNYSRFVLATDFKIKADQRSLNTLKELLSIEHAGLEVVHVIEKPGATRPGKDLEMAVTRKLEDIPHIFHYIHDTNVSRALGVFLESVNATGLVTIAHEHTLLHKLFFKSVSRTLSHHTTVPMLVLHG